MVNKHILNLIVGSLLGIYGLVGLAGPALAVPPLAGQYDAYPPFMANNPPPLVMLVMGRNHKLYYEAYNDASDLNEDGVLDTTYKPDEIDYYGYFDSFKYYVYDSANGRFNPVATTTDKKAPSGSYWSGDFLNYLTMSRMDAIRKVLYGGLRSTDTATETVLQRAYIPQDAHSWGKEYESVATNGYDIRDYTPLDLPVAGMRHLFANTTLSDNGDPLLRVLDNSQYRIWEWVSIERPVAGDKCLDGGSGPNCVTAGGTSWETVPASPTAGLSGVTQSFYDMTGGSHPTNHTEYDTLLATYATVGNFQGDQLVNTIDGSGNPFDGNPSVGDDDYYLSIFDGTLNIPSTGTYTFAVDGDDAVELLIDGAVVAGWYGGHGSCGCNTYSGTATLTAGSHTFQFRHEEMTGDDNYYLRWAQLVPASSMTDYEVRVLVADPTMPETNCKLYPGGNYKPTGLLQRNGETNGMYFGLVTGSYTNNTSGGVLRKNIGSIQDEIDLDNGVLTSFKGIIRTLDQLRIVDFNYSDHTYNSNCGWVTTRAINEGECRMWGNPVGEMMYEGMRYFAGENATSDFEYAGSIDNAAGTALDLPKPAWVDPYTTYPSCSKPFILTISDIYPTYDSDQLPGSYFSGQAAETLGAASSALNVSTIANTIFTNEESAGNRFIGQRNATFDGACTAKNVTGFSDIRGLCPEEPTKQGSYYSAAVAHYGKTEDLNGVDANQNVSTYAIGLASPLPNIEIPIQGKIVRLVPFAKSVGGSSISAAQGSFQPTNTIVDFYVEEILPHRGTFRINFEDVEQGADHDMDAIVVYNYQLVDAGGNPVTAATISSAVAVDIQLSSTYAAGGIIQHIGYIISGTTNDGTYLEVRDLDTAAGSDPDYFLDTPPGVWADTGGTAWDDNVALPLNPAPRRFTVDAGSGSGAASLLPNPLWYAAKWGGFVDSNANNIPDLDAEWDKDADGVPDTYFYVVNPLKLEQQLNKSFADILSKTSSGTAAAVVANNSEGQGTMIQAFFKPTYVSPSNEELTWIGYLKSLWVDPFGHLREDSNNDDKLNFATDKIIEYGSDGNGNAFVKRYTQHYHYDAGNQYNEECVVADCTTAFTTIGIEDINPIFAAGQALYNRPAADRTIFTFIDGNGSDDDSIGRDLNGDGNDDIGTFIDQSGENEGGKIVGQVLSPTSDLFNDNNGELILFDTANFQRIKPFLGLKDNTAFSYLETGGPSQDQRVKNLINYIRGLDSADLTGNPPTRNRTYGGNVWKLGDIVRSTPASVSGAIENYDIIYNDESYLSYIRKYKDRETVVYAGANDGMLHAFTHGRFAVTGAESGYEMVGGTPIGTELWAYIPQTLLPHLKWLASPSYGHSFYVDLKPKVFDARIFTDDIAHPGGWGTVLLVGLGAGGKDIWAEGDFGNGDVVRRFYPTYICLDITEPRTPRLLWERSYEHLGMSTSYPTVLQVGATYDSTSQAWSIGEWYTVFGSGPHDSVGKTDYNGYSDQQGHIFAVRLKDGELLRDFNTNLDAAVMNSPSSLDKGSETDAGPVKGLTYNVDAVYIGAANQAAGQWAGAMFKINTRDTGTVPSTDPLKWSLSTLYQSDRPITAPPSLTLDALQNVWVHFGTGRFQEMLDRVTTEQQYIIGIKDPYFNKQYDPLDSNYNGIGNNYLDNSNARTLTQSDLFYANPYESPSGTNGIVPITDPFGIAGKAAITSWSILLDTVRNTDGDTSDYFDGWYRKLDARTVNTLPSERVISKPAILSGVLFLPIYVPDDDVCGFGGSTDIYALYYETGTPLWRHIFNPDSKDYGDLVDYRLGTMINTGPPPPMVSAHIGREKGATIYSQTGTGPILEAQVYIKPIKSDVMYWNEPE